MKIFNQLTETMRQGGVRRGANMGILSVDHPDILEFIRMKEDPNVMKNFNVSIAVTGKFMKAVEKNEDYNLINPRTKKAVKKLNAREVFNLITQQAWQTGDPGMVFMDEINRKNSTKHIGKIESTNPCGEVPLHPWESCNLGSINLSQFVTDGEVEWEKLSNAVRDSVRFLDNMIDVNKYPLPEIKKATLANRRIGLGVMGFAEMLILLGIPYNSNKALKTADKLMKFIEKEAVKMSSELGRGRGSFPNFKGSMWQKKYRAMRNATSIVIAPTGTISIIAGCSSGIEPLFAVSFVRHVMEGTRLIESNRIFDEIAKEKGFFSEKLLMKIAKTGSIQGMKEIPKNLQKLFVTALQISPEYHVKMQAVFQKHTHGAVSKTINLPEDVTVDEVRKAYKLAWKLKCKGITIYRYGSKPDQVLTVGPVTADSEFAGGCPAGVCAETTT
jgi:ribonucleoside-diphosphate reductase alpha chain